MKREQEGVEEEIATADDSSKEFPPEGSGEIEQHLEGNTGSRESFLKGIDVPAYLDFTEKGKLLILGKELGNSGRS